MLREQPESFLESQEPLGRCFGRCHVLSGGVRRVVPSALVAAEVTRRPGGALRPLGVRETGPS